jgi:hypothetical protein
MHLSRGASAPVPRDEAFTQILGKAKGEVQGQTWCSFLISGQGERETDRFEQSCAPRVLASSYPIRKQLLISQNVTCAI